MYYPLFINLAEKKALIVGGGNVGSRRALYLLKAGAIVTVVSEEFDKQIASIKNRNLKLLKKKLSSKNIDDIKPEDYFLVVLASNDQKINSEMSARIARICKKSNNKAALVCRTDNHLKGNVIFPSVSQIGKNTVAFTTYGKNPILSRKVKGCLARLCKTTQKE